VELALNIRPPAVAGQFYPSNKDELYELIHRTFTDSLGPGKFPTASSTFEENEISKIECLIVPHAGYVYSGPVAAHSYNVAFQFFRKFKNESKIIVIILGPNHYGIGSGVALSEATKWRTPLGDVKVATDMGKNLIKSSKILDIDEVAHSMEHSIEVQIPFLQAVAGSIHENFSILPISLMLQDVETAREVAEELFPLIKKEDMPFLVIGSSDLTHYEPHETASRKDHLLLEEVEKVQVSSFYTTLERRNISACGYGAVAAVMHLSHKLDKRRGKLLKYATSGETSGDMSSVVGYSAVHFIQ
jgi:MEMO1 family protein